MAGTSSYARHDAALKALGKEEYRALLEATLAWHIGQEGSAAADDPGHAPYLRGEINGVCLALRLLGGYEGVAFDREWARSIPPASFAWRRFLGYRDEGAPAEAVTPHAEGPSPRPGTRMLDLPASPADPLRQAAESTIPAAEKARRYRHKLVDLLEKAEAVFRPGTGKGELAALADEAHTVRTQLDAEERWEARLQAVGSPSGAIGAPRPSKQ
jgi:hypothetical protein